MKTLTEKALAAQRICMVNNALKAYEESHMELLETVYCSLRKSAEKGFYSVQVDEAPALKNAEVQTYLTAQGFHVTERTVSWLQ